MSRTPLQILLDEPDLDLNQRPLAGLLVQEYQERQLNEERHGLWVTNEELMRMPAEQVRQATIRRAVEFQDDLRRLLEEMRRA